LPYYDPIITQPLVESVYTSSKLEDAVSNVKSAAAPSILLPFRKSWHVVTADLLEILILSPVEGFAGSVKFKLAVNT
jgi:hypothetical protein